MRRYLTSSKDRQSGVTLVELMVGMVVGLIVVAGVLDIYVTTIKSSNDTLKSIRLNQELRTAMDIITGELRRAGYCDADAGTCEPNPFTTVSANALTLFDQDGDSTTDDGCVMFSYDSDGDATVDTGTGGDLVGFRLDSTNGTVDMNTSPTTTANCATDGSNGTWSALTDEDTVEVTGLRFDDSGTSCLDATTGTACSSPAASDDLVYSRLIKVTLTGNLKSDTNDTNYTIVSKTVTQYVHVRNDLVEIN